jgi:DNA-binding transcriptional LysR family regulator
VSLDFDLVDLRLFVNVVDTLSLTRGAERSHLSTPAASARIRKMEQALGTQLFYRIAQGLAPTSAGHTVLRHALVILGQVGQLTGELRGNAGSMTGNIRLYANTLSISEFIPPALQKFLLNFPGMNIDLHERASVDIARALKQGAADIGIVSADIPSEGLECMPYRTERLVLVTPRGHPLAGSKPIDFGQTLDADYIGLKEDTALQSFIMRAASREGVPMKLRIQVNNFEALCSLVDSGVGVAIIPESVARRHAQRFHIAIVALRDDWAIRDLKIAVRDMQSLAAPAKALIEVLVAPAA